MSRGSFGQRVKAAEAPEMMVPEVKPTTTEYTIKPALVVAKLKQNITTAVVIPPTMNAFNRPNLSANMPGMTRPNVDAAFKIASKYPERVALMPLDTA